MNTVGTIPKFMDSTISHIEGIQVHDEKSNPACNKLLQGRRIDFVEIFFAAVDFVGNCGSACSRVRARGDTVADFTFSPKWNQQFFWTGPTFRKQKQTRWAASLQQKQKITKSAPLARIRSRFPLKPPPRAKLRNQFASPNQQSHTFRLGRHATSEADPY